MQRTWDTREVGLGGRGVKPAVRNIPATAAFLTDAEFDHQMAAGPSNLRACPAMVR